MPDTTAWTAATVAMPELAIGQAESARDRRAGMRRRHRTPADELREAWQSATRCGPPGHWGTGQQWWTPAIDAVTRAVAVGRDPVPPLTRLGRERAAAGIGLGQTLDDLNVFYRLCGRPATPPGLVRAVAAGWLNGTDAG